jgi:DNA-directed RNA polymerase subunit M/transcription elongation factor TFIIS
MSNRFDVEGTAPGLANSATPEVEVVHMKCPKNGCKSVRATEVIQQNNNPNMGATHLRIYQCIECRHTWPVNTGGFVNF